MTRTRTRPAGAGAATRRRTPVLACSVVGAAVVALDGTVLTVAQPALQRELHADVGQVQWTSTGYLVAVASLLVLAGRLGDRYGHRRIFAVGALGFAATSAAVALAPGIRAVILLRVLQGVCGALLQPATLGMLRTAYPPERLSTPIAVRTAAIGLAAAAGPLVGGALVSAYGWRSVFLLGVPPTLAIGLVALATRDPDRGTGPDTRRERDPLDPGGALLLAAALGLLVHGLVEAARPGGAGTALVACAASIAAGLLFVRHERRTERPLLPPGLLRGGPVVAGLAVLLAASAALFGTLLVATYFLQDVQRLDPLHCALRVLPLALCMVLGAPLCPPLQRRFGPRRTATAGAALLASGVLLISTWDATAGAVAVGAGSALLGAGFVALMVTATSVVVHRAPEAHAGVAGGLQQTVMNIGPALGVATATLLLALVPQAGFVPDRGVALPALAAIAVLALPAALALPGRRDRAGTPRKGASGTRPGAPPPGSGQDVCVRS
ncbi:MFS transporter [Streptomyces sp. NPDC051180]|uniref:MFS transporter n=1 Tax=Streptomyces sp. NPDC051180 TaxID=3155797 RepID=UPI00344B1FC6